MNAAKKPKTAPAEKTRPSDRTRARVHQLEAEIEEYRKLLGLNQPRRMDEWLSLPQDLRDEMAVRALWDEYCDHGRAAQKLGFEWFGVNGDKDGVAKSSQNQAKRANNSEIMEKVFGTPGVRARLSNALEDAEANRLAVIKRLTQTTLHADDDKSTRAAQVLAKLQHWTNDEPPAQQTTIHLWGLTAAASGRGAKSVTTIEHEGVALQSDDPRVILGHTPGDPIPMGKTDE